MDTTGGEDTMDFINRVIVSKNGVPQHSSPTDNRLKERMAEKADDFNINIPVYEGIQENYLKNFDNAPSY